MGWFFCDDATIKSSNGQINVYDGGGKNEPHEHSCYNTSNGSCGWIGENVFGEKNIGITDPFTGEQRLVSEKQIHGWSVSDANDNSPWN